VGDLPPPKKKKGVTTILEKSRKTENGEKDSLEGAGTLKKRKKGNREWRGYAGAKSTNIQKVGRRAGSTRGTSRERYAITRSQQVEETPKKRNTSPSAARQGQYIKEGDARRPRFRVEREKRNSVRDEKGGRKGGNNRRETTRNSWGGQSSDIKSRRIELAHPRRERGASMTSAKPERRKSGAGERAKKGLPVHRFKLVFGRKVTKDTRRSIISLETLTEDM